MPFREADQAAAIVNRVCLELAAERGDELSAHPRLIQQEALPGGQVGLKVAGDSRSAAKWSLEADLRRRLKRAFDAERLEMEFAGVEPKLGFSPPSGSRRGNICGCQSSKGGGFPLFSRRAVCFRPHAQARQRPYRLQYVQVPRFVRHGAGQIQRANSPTTSCRPSDATPRRSAPSDANQVRP